MGKGGEFGLVCLEGGGREGGDEGRWGRGRE